MDNNKVNNVLNEFLNLVNNTNQETNEEVRLLDAWKLKKELFKAYLNILEECQALLLNKTNTTTKTPSQLII